MVFQLATSARSEDAQPGHCNHCLKMTHGAVVGQANHARAMLRGSWIWRIPVLRECIID